MADYYGVDVSDPICPTRECGRPGTAGRGYCRRCYVAWYRAERRAGRTVTRQRADPAERFRAKLARQPDGCLHYTGAVNDYGYGVFQLEPGKTIQAHIFAWMLAHDGERPPAGMTLDHVCHDPKACPGGVACPHRRCCDDRHLAVKTRGDNAMAGNSRAAHNKAKERCPADHLYDDANTGRRGGRRYCRACARIKARAKRLGLTFEEAAALDQGPRS
jgi:hypothetical protein